MPHVSVSPVERDTVEPPALPAGWRNDVFVGRSAVTKVTATRDTLSNQPSAEMVGLTTGPVATPRRNAVDFAMYFVQFGEDMVFRIYEAGIFKTTVGNTTLGDQMQLRRQPDGTVEYFLNGHSVYISEQRATRDLFFHSSFWSQAFGESNPDPSGHTVVTS